MASITQASTIIAKVQLILQDTTGVRWTAAELLGWLNDAQREICTLRGDAYITIPASMPLVAGSRQALPSLGIILVDVIRNMGADGNTPGRAIRKIDRKILDAQVPLWHTGTPSATISHYIFDEHAPKTFYVYPPAATPTYLEVLYVGMPADLTSSTQVINIDDIYQNALIDYVLWRCYSKDTEYTANADRAKAYRMSFENTLSLKAKADEASESMQSNERG